MKKKKNTDALYFMCSDCIIVTTRLCFGVSGLDPESTRSRMAYKNDKYSVTYFFSRRYYHDIIANLRTELREMPWSQVRLQRTLSSRRKKI